MSEKLVCWKCGHSIEDLPMPLSREVECKNCFAQLHVCKLCEFYNPNVADQCDEPIADFVKEKERANFCDYFKPVQDAYKPVDYSDERKSVSELDKLFGLEQSQDDDEMTEAEKSRSKLDDLFK